MPRQDRGNYARMQIFWSAINVSGRAGFVIDNFASDARRSEQEIRKKMVDDRGVDVIVAFASNSFVNVTLPCILWFFDKREREIDRKDKVLVMDARNVLEQVNRAHREFRPEPLEFLANIVRDYRAMR